MKFFSKIVFVMMFVAFVIPRGVSAAPINLSFSGQVDISGASVGGVNAPLGSDFTLDLLIDDALAASGEYAIQGVSYTTTVGTYTTIGSWARPLIATQTGPSISLINTDRALETNGDGEHFSINLTNFGPASFDNPLSWNGATGSGDIIVRGLGGFDSPDQLSGLLPYQGTLTASASPAPIPAPSAMLLFGTGLIGLAAWRFRAKNRH